MIGDLFGLGAGSGGAIRGNFTAKNKKPSRSLFFKNLRY